ncbi:DUF736 domain-containing protein [Ancylobacter polymorphus]|uniref:DUF736 domain-containing protein n=1 Tax=Ancylobacter polymorphus TaxID=223390 RepID=UPI003D767A52
MEPKAIQPRFLNNSDRHRRTKPALGAAWQRATDEGRDYLSVKLDDPSFREPLYATLVEVEGEEGLQLIWSRPRRD